MPYTFYPHSHVKIWFTNNPDVFMNFVNQTRLIGMRERNPHDTFHLIYDSELLSEKAHQDLIEFCTEFNIIPVDADSFAGKLETQEETELYAFYKDEIRNLNEGGNLGVASDIIRVLRNSFRLGHYTDLDVPVDTNHLPDSITVEAPFLLNIGSLNLFTNKEMMFILNEYIAVADEEAAKEQIQKIHEGMLSKLKNYSSDYIQQTEAMADADNIISAKMLGYMKNRAEYAYIQKSSALNPGEGKTTSRDYRAYVNRIMSDASLYLEFHRQSPEQSHEEIIAYLREDLQQQLSFVKWLFFRKEYKELVQLLALDDAHFITAMMKKERSLYLKSIVVGTTGPLEVTRSFFGRYDLDSEEVDRLARPAAFSHYNLHKAFLSRNVIPLHQSVWGMLRYLGASVGELNDSSWLEEGMHLQRNKAKKLEELRDDLVAEFPVLIMLAKQDIKKQINNLSFEKESLIGSLNSYRKIAKRVALQRILDLLEEDQEIVDLRRLRLILTAIKTNSRVMSGNISHRTQSLVEDLDKLCEKAIDLNIIKVASMPAEVNDDVVFETNSPVISPNIIDRKEDEKEEVLQNPGSFCGLFAPNKNQSAATEYSEQPSNKM